MLGRFYSARNVLGFYRLGNALTLCSYSTKGHSDPDSWFRSRFSQALYQTIQHHPSLCYGIVDQTADKEAVLFRLPAVYQEDVAEFRGQDSKIFTEKEIDQEIENLLSEWHAKILTDGNRKPAWRVVIFKHGARWNEERRMENQLIQKVSIAFLANHAIADGISHVNFHRTLLYYFNKNQQEDNVWPYNVPADLRTPVLLEDAVDLLSRDEGDGGQISYDTTYLWSGEKMFLPSPEEYESGLRIITVPLLDVKRLLSFCKKSQISLTGLLHGLLVTFLSRAVPPKHGFRAVTPYSMRHISKVPDDEICNHVSALVNDFPESLVTAIHKSAKNSDKELQLILEVARNFHHDMKAELSRAPKNNVWAGMFGDIDWYAQAKGQLGQKRALTYELSNVGNQKIFKTPELQASSLLQLEKAIISQCGSVTGPVIAVNCISTLGGPLTVTLAWQKGSCEESLIDSMVVFLRRRLTEDFEDAV